MAFVEGFVSQSVIYDDTICNAHISLHNFCLCAEKHGMGMSDRLKLENSKINMSNRFAPLRSGNIKTIKFANIRINICFHGGFPNKERKRWQQIKMNTRSGFL